MNFYNRLLLIRRVMLSKKNIINSIIHKFLLFITLLFLLFFILLPIVKKHYISAPYKYPTYDVELSECSMYQYDKIAENENTNSIIGFAGPDITNVELSYKENVWNSTVFSLKSKSFNDLDKTPFVSKFMISINYNIINNNENVVMISKYCAEKTKAKVGDKVTLKLMDIKYEYIVGAIYETCVSTHLSPTNLSPVIVLYKGAVKEFIENRSSYSYYSEVYVNFKDKEKGKKFILDNYYLDQLLYKKYGEDYMLKANPRELESRKDGYEFRQIKFRERIGASVYTPTFMISVGTLFSAAILMLLIHEKSKIIKLASKSIGILASCGCQKSSFFWYFYVTSLIEQTILFTLSLLIIKPLLFNNYLTYLPWNLLIQYIPYLICVILLSSLIISLISLNLIRKDKIMSTVNEQEEGIFK